MAGELVKKISEIEISAPATEVKMFLLCFLVYAYFITGFHSANEGSALALTRSIVDYQTLSIDNYKDLASVDISSYNGRYYSDKAPGRAFLGVPIYLADKLFGWTQEHQIFFSMELLTVFISSLSVVLLYRFCLFLKISRGISLLLSLIYGFATLLWPFSKTFFAHSYSAFFNLLALFALLIALRGGKRKYLVYAGASLGLSVLFEYTNLAVALFLFVYYFFEVRSKNLSRNRSQNRSRNRLRNIQFFDLSFLVLPFLAVISILFIYNYSIFGNPLVTTYNFQYSYGNIAESTYFKFDALREGLPGLLISSWRGLFYYFPILLLSILGFFYWFKYGDGEEKRLAAVLLLSFLAILFFYAASPAWRGGNSYGPRYLLAVMPFIVLPMWKTIERHRKDRIFHPIFGVLLAYSIIFSATGSFAGPSPAESFTDPFWQQSYPLLMSGFLDSFIYGQNKTSIYVMILAAAFILGRLLKDFSQTKIKHNKKIKQSK